MDPTILAGFAVVAMIITFFVHGFLAIGVFVDSLEQVRQGKRLYFLWPIGWGLLTWVTGMLGAAFYWTMQHSTLRRDP